MVRGGGIEVQAADEFPVCHCSDHGAKREPNRARWDGNRETRDRDGVPTRRPRKMIDIRAQQHQEK